jgi:hypothetical protein
MNMISEYSDRNLDRRGRRKVRSPELAGMAMIISHRLHDTDAHREVPILEAGF